MTVLQSVSQIYTPSSVNLLQASQLKLFNLQLLSFRVSTKPGGVLQELLGGDVPLGPWNPQSIPELVQANFATLHQTKLPKSTPPPPPPNPRVAVFPKLLRSNTVQPKQNRFDFFIFWSGNSRFPQSRLKSSANLISLNGK